MNVVTYKWVYRIKHRSNGSVVRYKACLVAWGFTQQVGLDYNETFNPMIKPTTIRVVLALAATLKWQIKQLDVANAFLNGPLSEEVYMSQAPGHVDPQFPNHVYLLQIAIYGLHQAPQAWYN